MTSIELGAASPSEERIDNTTSSIFITAPSGFASKALSGRNPGCLLWQASVDQLRILAYRQHVVLANSSCGCCERLRRDFSFSFFLTNQLFRGSELTSITSLVREDIWGGYPFSMGCVRP